MINKKWVIIIFISILMLILSSIYLLIRNDGNYEKSFQRSYNSENERNAICIAENINYTSYMNLDRFYYDWANYIDTTVIGHYNDSFLQDKESGYEYDICYEYFAWGKYYENMDIEINSDGWQLHITINEENPLIGSKNNFVNGMINFDARIGYLDNTTWKIVLNNSRVLLDEDFSFNYSMTDGYFVEMYLGYDESRGPLAATYIHTRQVIFLDHNFEVHIILVQPSEHRVS